MCSRATRASGEVQIEAEAVAEGEGATAGVDGAGKVEVEATLIGAVETRMGGQEAQEEAMGAAMEGTISTSKLYNSLLDRMRTACLRTQASHKQALRHSRRWTRRPSRKPCRS